MTVRRIALALAALAPLVIPATARGQGILQLEPITGDVTLDFNGYASSSGAVSSSSTNILRESLGIRFAGAVSSPSLLRFDLSLRPAFTQGRWSTAGQSDTGSGSTLYGGGSVRLLTGGPVAVWGRAHRSRDEFSGLFGQETVSEAEGFVFGADLKSPLLNVNASYTENSSDALWSSPTTAPRRRIQDRSQFMLNVTNSKTRVRFQRLEVHDDTRPTGFLRYQTLATNRHRWGKGSSLLSRLSYTDQSGVGSVKSFLWGQNTHLQHTRLISTDLRYSVTDVQTQSDRIRGWNVGLNEMVRLSQQLAFLLDGSGSRQTASVGSVTNWRIQPRVRANTRLPAGIRLGLGAGVGYRWRFQDTGEGGTRTVTGEPHVVPPSGRFLLEELEPDPTTVRITNEEGTLLYEPGADYRLFDAGSLLEVIVLPGGRIATGDALLVDYEHVVLGSADSELLSWSYGIDLQYKGLQVYHSLAANERTKSSNPLEPDAGENRNVVGGIRYQAATPLGALSVAGEWRQTALAGESSEMLSLDADLSFLIDEDWRGTAGAGWSSRRDGSQYRLYRAFGRLQWNAMRTLQVYADLSANSWDRIDQDELYVGGAIGADWNVGLLTVGARLERRHIDSGVERVQTRMMLRASRRF